MAEILNYSANDTSITLALNGDENNLLTFDPGDLNLRKNFYETSNIIKTKEREFDIRVKKINPNNTKAILDLEDELFRFMSSTLDKLFGVGTTKKVCGNRKNIVVIANFLIAIAPYFKKFNDDAKNKYLNNLKITGTL